MIAPRPDSVRHIEHVERCTDQDEAMSSRRTPNPARRPRHAALACCFALALAACGSTGSSDAGALPDVELTELQTGSIIDASEIDGPAIVNLWATWCGPCRAEMPAFQAVSIEFVGVRFVGVNQGDDGDAALEFLDEVGVTFDQYLDPTGELTDALRVAGLPATFVIGADGEVVEVHSGALDADGIRELVALVDDSVG